MPDMVNHPAHYNIPGRKECLDEMIDLFGLQNTIIFCSMNSYKYRYRADLKGGQQDLQKAEWYDRKAAELMKRVI